jgi:Spy/CpxP family protein refolding chaperone
MYSKKVSALVLLLCIAGVSLAQSPPTDHPSGPPNPELRLEHLAVLLDLSDTQKVQVKAVFDAEHAKMKAQFEAARASGTRPSFEEMRAAREQRRAEVIQELTPILNAAQLKKFEVLLDEERGPWARHPGHGPHGQPPGDTPPASN